MINYVGSTDPLWGTSWTPADINNVDNFGVTLDVRNASSNNRTANVDYITITITYSVDGSLDWYTVSSGGTKIGSDSPFNPVGVLNSGLPNTNTPGTTTFYAACSLNPECRTAVDFVINPAPSQPTITPIGPIDLCTTGGVPVTLQSSSGSGYKWYRNTVLLGGETNQTINTILEGDYTVTVTSGGCTSLPSVPTTIRSITPSITPAAAATSVCFSAADQPTLLTYSNPINDPTTYSITWNAIPANTFAQITDASLSGGSPITITVPGNTPAGTYTGNITVKSDVNCVSTSTSFTVTVHANPVATFSYSALSYCTNNPATPSPVYSGGGVGGTFSFSALPGHILSLNASTGQITLGTSTPGDYTVTNTVSENGCTTTYSVPVTILNQPTVNISYAGSPFCNTITTAQPVTKILTGGTLVAVGSYSASPTGLTINTLPEFDQATGTNPLAGWITPSSSTPGTYTVTYTFSNGVCSNTATTTVTIYSTSGY